jgi:hypothetical protein
MLSEINQKTNVIPLSEDLSDGQSEEPEELFLKGKRGGTCGGGASV